MVAGVSRSLTVTQCCNARPAVSAGTPCFTENSQRQSITEILYFLVIIHSKVIITGQLSLYLNEYM